MPSSAELGWYSLPVIPTFLDGDKAVNDGMGKILGKLGDLGKRSGASLGKGLGDGLSSAENEVRKATESYGKLRDKAADALGKIRVEEEKLAKARAGGKADQIVAAEERLAKARRDSARTNREAIASYGEIEAAQKRLANSSGGLLDKMKGLGGAALGGGREAATGFVEGFGGPIAALGTKAGPIGLALAAAAGLAVGAGAVLAKNLMSAMEREPGRDLVQAQLGIDEASMAQLGAAASSSYVENFGASIQDNLGTAKTALQSGLLSGINDPNTSDVINQLTSVAGLLGEEIPAVARSAGQMIRTGLADNADAAFDLIVKGQQAGLNTSSDWLDTLNEYGTQFRKLGLSGPEAVGLISQAMKGGARDSDVAADALKEFSIRAVDGSKTTRQAYRDLGFDADGMSQRMAAGGPVAKAAFGEILAAIGSIKDPLQQSQIAVALFGTQAEDLGGAFNQFDLSNAVTQLGDVDGAARRASDTMGNNTAGTFESAKRRIEVSLQAVQDKLLQGFAPAIEQAATWVTTHQDEIIDFFVEMGVAATYAAEFAVKSVGEIAGALGDIIAPVGDAMGVLLKGQAWVDEHIRGNKEDAEESRRQAEEMFSLGEGLQRFRDTASNIDFGAARDRLRELGDSAKEAAESSDTATTALGGLSTQTAAVGAGLESVPWDAANGGLSGLSDSAATGTTNFKAFTESLADASGAVSLFGDAANGLNGLNGALDPATILGSGGSLFGAAANGVTASGQSPYGLPVGSNSNGYGGSGVKFPDWVYQLGAAFNVKPSTYPGHQEGSGQNQGIDWVGSVPDMQRFAEFLTAAKPQGLEQVIWQNPMTNKALGLTPSGEVVTRTDGYYRNDWAAHRDHVHTRQSLSIPVPSAAGRGAAAVPSQQMPVAVIDLGAGATVLPVPSPAADLGTTASSPIDLSRNDIANAPVNAFGAEFEPGFGTPGYRDGEPGYFRADPKQVREADQRAQDAQNRILDADAAVAAALARVNELDADASESQRQSAQEAVRKAKVDAQTARREAQDARTDLEEARKGDFTAARKASTDRKAKGGRDGGGEFGELGNIFGSFLKETFGLDGSIFPDLSNLAPVKALGTVLGAFQDPMQAAIDGTTGAGATEVDPFSGAVDTGPSTSTLPFGMIPGVSSLLPPTSPSDPAAPSLHRGAGAAPGPIDQSTRITINNPQGDEASIANRTRQTLLRTPRLGTYSPPGVGQ